MSRKLKPGVVKAISKMSDVPWSGSSCVMPVWTGLHKTGKTGLHKTGLRTLPKTGLHKTVSNLWLC